MATTTQTRKARTAKAAPADQVKADAEAVLDGLVDGTPDATLQFLTALAGERARAQQLGLFKLWSINNRCYLEGQVRRRKASVRNLFAGVKQWEKMGRSVKDDQLEAPYKIQGSPFYTVAGDPDPVTGEATREERFGRSATIAVYDWTQTVALDPEYVEPDWEVPVAAGDLATLRQLAAASEVPVSFTDLSSTNGHARRSANEIVVDASIMVGNQIFALATALAAHHLGHPVTRPAVKSWAADAAQKREAADVAAAEATLVGWMVARALGLDEDTDGAVTELASDYLHSWVKVNADGTEMELAGTKSRRKMLRAKMDEALRAADAILASYNAAAVEPAAATASVVA